MMLAFMEIITLPWLIEMNLTPLWLDVILITSILMGWLILISRAESYFTHLSRESFNDNTDS